MKIVVICGSTHVDSLNLRVAKVAHATVQAAGHESVLVHLGDENLPLFRGYDEEYPPRVKELIELLKTADGYILVTPEYHHAVPAALKSFFEYLDGDELEDRPVAIMSASDGRFGGLQSQWSIHGMLRTLGLWVVPDELYIPKADEIFLPDGTITDEKIKQRVEDLSRRLVRAAELLKPLRTS
ncbi:MAG: NAD(P)H-dependent oxidoreductase [bacterium]|nr:NAD(P)H-dependent oxidoreductase [bacterium]